MLKEGARDNQIFYFKKTDTYKNKWQGLALGARSGVRKNITHRKKTEEQKLKMTTIAPK